MPGTFCSMPPSKIRPLQMTAHKSSLNVIGNDNYDDNYNDNYNGNDNYTGNGNDDNFIMLPVVDFVFKHYR